MLMVSPVLLTTKVTGDSLPLAIWTGDLLPWYPRTYTFTLECDVSAGSRLNVTVTAFVAPVDALAIEDETFVTCLGIPAPVEPFAATPRI